VGRPIAGHTRLETEGLIGFFVHILVLRTDGSGDPTFREFLKRVEKVALEAYDHQEIPFEKLVEELQPRRDPARNPLFQIAFALQNFPPSELSNASIKVTRVTTLKSPIRFDLEVHFEETEHSLKGLFIYNTALFQ